MFSENNAIDLSDIDDKFQMFFNYDDFDNYLSINNRTISTIDIEYFNKTTNEINDAKFTFTPHKDFRFKITDLNVVYDIDEHNNDISNLVFKLNDTCIEWLDYPGDSEDIDLDVFVYNNINKDHKYPHLVKLVTRDVAGNDSSKFLIIIKNITDLTN